MGYWMDQSGKSACCCTLSYKISQNSTVNSCYFSIRIMLHIRTINVKYLDNWGYISRRFVFRISTTIDGWLRSNGLNRMDRMEICDMIWHEKTCCCTLSYKTSIAQHETLQHIYINSGYFSSRNTLHILKTHATYLDNWGYISGRFMFRISTIVMFGLRINGLLHKWIELAFRGMIWYDKACYSTLLYKILITQLWT